MSGLAQRTTFTSPSSPESHAARGRLGGLRRVGASRERVEAAQREIKVAAAEDYIRRLVDSAPPLTESQRARLAALLAPTVRREVLRDAA